MNPFYQRDFLSLLSATLKFKKIRILENFEYYQKILNLKLGIWFEHFDLSNFNPDETRFSCNINQIAF